MNNLRRFCVGLILTLGLTASTFAGQIECPGVVEPQTQEATVAGEMPNGIESTDTVTQIVISLLTDLLPLI